MLDARKHATQEEKEGTEHSGHDDAPEVHLRIAERSRRIVPATVDIGGASLAQRRKEMEATHAAIGHADRSFGGARDAPPPPRPLTPMAQPVSAFTKGACAMRGAQPRPRSAAGDGAGSPMPVHAGDVRAGSAVFSLSATPAHDQHDGHGPRPTSPSHDRSRLPQRSPPRVRGALGRLVGPEHGAIDRPGSAAPAVAERVAGSTSAIARRIEEAKAGAPKRVTSAPPRRRVVTGNGQHSKAGGGAQAHATRKAMSLSALGGSASSAAASGGEVMDRVLRARGVVHVPAS
jgi:hypothetical protein